MPLYAYSCRDCGETFETLVMTGETAPCRACASEKLEQQISLIAAPRRGGERAPAPEFCAAGDIGACCGGAGQTADA